MGTYWGADGKTVDGRYDVNIRSSGGLEPSINGVFDSDTSGQAIYTVAHGKLFNESTWDRQRGNTQGTLLASAARTALGTNTPNMTNYNAKGVTIFLNITTASGTGGLAIRILAVDPVSGGAVYLNIAPTAILATGIYAYELYPLGAVPTATAGNNNVNQYTNGVLPRTWYVFISAGDATSYTYSVGYSLIL